MKPSKDISRLLEIMQALRNPDTGCPWDIEQDFKSIAPYTIEEAYEVADAIERENHEDLCEELGDLLLQVVYHARMAEEISLFDFGDVVEAITEKMIRRHPHVFGDEIARNAGMAKGAWERIKVVEKQKKLAQQRKAGIAVPRENGLLSDISPSLPGISRAMKIQQKAAGTGFDWDEPIAVLNKIREELDELEAEMKFGNQNNIHSELGDVFFSLINISRHLDIDPESTIRSANEKFINRFRHMESALADAGKSLDETGRDELETLWQAAKNSGK